MNAETLFFSAILLLILYAISATIWSAISWGEEDPNHLKLPDDWEPRVGVIKDGSRKYL